MSRGVPVRARDLHQTVTKQQHQQEQAPGVGCRDPNGLELVPDSGQEHNDDAVNKHGPNICVKLIFLSTCRNRQKICA